MTLYESNRNCLFGGSPAIHSTLIEFKLFCGKNLDKMAFWVSHDFLTAQMFYRDHVYPKPKEAERSDSVTVSAALYSWNFRRNANDLVLRSLNEMGSAGTEL